VYGCENGQLMDVLKYLVSRFMLMMLIGHRVAEEGS